MYLIVLARPRPRLGSQSHNPINNKVLIRKADDSLLVSLVSAFRRVCLCLSVFTPMVAVRARWPVETSTLLQMEHGTAVGGDLPHTPFAYRLVPPKNPTCNNCRVSKIRCDRVYPVSQRWHANPFPAASMQSELTLFMHRVFHHWSARDRMLAQQCSRWVAASKRIVALCVMSQDPLSQSVSEG